jgi:hypothetical protein
MNTNLMGMDDTLNSLLLIQEHHEAWQNRLKKFKEDMVGEQYQIIIRISQSFDPEYQKFIRSRLDKIDTILQQTDPDIKSIRESFLAIKKIYEEIYRDIEEKYKDKTAIFNEGQLKLLKYIVGLVISAYSILIGGFFFNSLPLVLPPLPPPPPPV